MAVIAIADETLHTMVRMVSAQMLPAETQLGAVPVARRPLTFALGHPKDSLSHLIWGLPLFLGSPSLLLGFPRLFFKTKEIPSLMPLFATLFFVLWKADLEIRLDEHTFPWSSRCVWSSQGQLETCSSICRPGPGHLTPFLRP